MPQNRIHIRDITVWEKAEVFYEKPKSDLNCELEYMQYENANWKLFCDEKEVKDLIVSKNIESIPNGNFYGCENIERVRFHENIKSIGAFAFCGCRALESVEFPKSLQKIGECAFMGCRLKAISLPDNVKIIKRGTFANSGLEFVKLPNELTSIEAEAFIDNPFLVSVLIPEKLKLSGNYAIMAFDDHCKCK